MSTTLTQSEPKEATRVRSQFLRPQYQVSADGDDFIVSVTTPGVSRDGVEITLEEETLTVIARRGDRVPESWKALSRELPDLDYRLRLQLNVRVAEEKISAKVENGILRIRLPKADEIKPRKIAID